jgi:lactate 2-monooxygenase
MTDPGRTRQTEIFLKGVAGDRPAVPTGFDELERRAKEALTPQSWAYISGGAGVGATMRANREAFDRRRIVPQLFRDVSKRDLSLTLFGTKLHSPVLLAPVGVLEMMHRGADIAVAQAARATRVPMIISSQASTPMEAIAAELGDSPRWYQLYWNTTNDVVASFVERAERCGCTAIVLTLDTTMFGWRTHDLDLASLPFLFGRGIAQYTSDPVFRSLLGETFPPPAVRPRLTLKTIAAILELRRHGAAAGLSLGEMRRAVQRFSATFSRPSLAWSDLAFLRSVTKLPIILKGIQHSDDARRAVDHGVDGIVVSNHGGRQIDGAVGSLDALPPVVAAIDRKMPVLFDSGIRSGADVFKAISLGATAVLLGRPFAYGLAIAGEMGAREVIRNVIAEFDLTVGLAGCTSLADLTPERLAT